MFCGRNIVLAPMQCNYAYISPLQEGAMKVVDTIPMVGLGNVQMVAIHGVFMQLACQ